MNWLKSLIGCFKSDLSYVDPATQKIIDHKANKDHSETIQISQEDFEMWAYGNPVPVDAIDRMHAWNKIHSDLLKLDSTDCMITSIQKIYVLYFQEKYENRP